MSESNKFGILTRGKDVKYKSKNRSHDDNLTVTLLMKEAENMDKIETTDKNINMFISLDLIKEFGSFLKQQDLKNFFKDLDFNETKNNESKNKKGKKNTIKKTDLMKMELEREKTKKDIQTFLQSLSIQNHYPLKKNKLHESFLNIIYWASYLIKNKKNDEISIELYFDCSISLYRSYQDCKTFINEKINEILIKVLNDLKKIIIKKDENNIHLLFEKYFYLINSSFWDKNKPNSITLYSEQKDAIRLIMNSIIHDKSLLMFYWVPPANGKTLISVIIARKMASHYNEKQKKNPNAKRKTLLYICYNEIVRNSVETLCLTHNVDIKFWLATYRKDMYKEHYFVRFRPDKSCFPDHIKVKTKELRNKDKNNEELRFSPDIRTQMLQYLDETRFVKDRIHEVESVETAPNLPEMIISDLDSAYELLKEFPDTFVPYFDEAFAASNQNITAQIMSVFPKTSVLVSATLATKEQIPDILNYFKDTHDASDEHIKYIHSNKQHINCQFISPEGNIISPHHNLNESTQIEKFIELMNKNPLIQRGYSNSIVLEMYLKLKDILPDKLKLDTLFEHYGSLSNDKIRNYGIELLNYCSENSKHFDKIKKIQICKIEDNSIENMLTKNAYVYQHDNTLHVSNPENYNLYTEYLVKDFLHNSPKLKKIIKDYEINIKAIHDEIANIEKNVKAKSSDKELQINEAQMKLSSINFDYPNEFIMNSMQHYRKFGNVKNTIEKSQKIMFNLDIINNFNDTFAKLYMSSIGVYNQTSLDSYETEIFLQFKDKFRFILADPSIIYGTNINLSMIDIHENMSEISTRNTLYQLIGRAGRKGQSSSANVIFRNWDLFNIIVEDSDKNIEANNIQKNLNKILKN